MNWSAWIRAVHRWTSIAFTFGVTVNFVAIGLNRYAAWIGSWPLYPWRFCS
jgi:hypothetical protein